MTDIIRPGIYRDFPVEAYHADPTPEPSLTQSMAKLLLERSPAHAAAAHPRLGGAALDDDDGPEKYDKAKAIGDAAHGLLLGRGKTIAVGEYPAWTSKDAKAFRSDALADGRLPILEKHFRQAERIAAHTRLALDGAGLDAVFNPAAGHAEVVVAWEERGIWFRTLIDWLATDLREATDLKTTGLSVAPHVIGKLAADAGWDIQAAFHERALDALDAQSRGRRTYRFVAVEQEPPYAVSIVEMPEAWLTMGRKKLAVATKLWSACMARGEWPAYPLAPIAPEYPGWMESRWLDRELTEFAELDAPHGRDKTGLPLSVLEAG